MNSCSSVKLGTGVPALVLRNLQWDLSLRVLLFRWDKGGAQTWSVFQAQLMDKNSITTSPVPIASGTALSHFSHKLIRATSQRKENSLQIGRRITVSAERQGKKKQFQHCPRNWLGFQVPEVFPRFHHKISSGASSAGLSSYLELNPSLWSSHPVCKLMSLKLLYICLPLHLSSDLWHNHSCSWTFFFIVWGRCLKARLGAENIEIQIPVSTQGKGESTFQSPGFCRDPSLDSGF